MNNSLRNISVVILACAAFSGGLLVSGKGIGRLTAAYHVIIGDPVIYGPKIGAGEYNMGFLNPDSDLAIVGDNIYYDNVQFFGQTLHINGLLCRDNAGGLDCQPDMAPLKSNLKKVPTQHAKEIENEKR